MKNDSVIAKRIIEQAFQQWINPEMEKRKREGKLPSGKIKFRAAQILFSVGGQPLVRINNEVRAVVEAKVKKSMKKGEKVFEKDIESIRAFHLIDEEKDFGHITIVKLTKGWFVGFSFIYDVSKSKKLYDIAIEFMKSAHSDLENKRHRSFIASLYVAAENLAKARLYLLPDKEIRKSKKHGTVHGKVNIYSRSDSIIKVRQKKAFNLLHSLRDAARYEFKFKLTQSKAKELFDSIKSLSKEVFVYLVRFGEVKNRI